MTRVASYLLNLGLSASDIAARSKMSVGRITAILEGAPLNAAELRSIGAGLGVPLRSLLSGGNTLSRRQELDVLFRAAPTGDNAATDGGVIYRVAEFVDAALTLLPTRQKLPDWINHFTIRDESFEEASRIAHLFRSMFTPSSLNEPLVDLPSILDRIGVIYSLIDRSRYEGASVASGGYSFAFVSPRFPGRMLFTLAHELGHLLVHHRKEGDAVFDLTSQIGGFRSRSKAEAFVNAFASVLLLPDQGVGQTLQVIRSAYDIKSKDVGDIEISLLARFYGVSFEVAALRCEQLRLLPRGAAFALADQIKKDFGSAEKRAEVLGLPPRQAVVFPRISWNLAGVAIKKIGSGGISAGWVSDRLGVSINELYSMHADLGDDDELSD